MNSEVFRFMSLRPPQLVKTDHVGPTIDLQLNSRNSTVVLPLQNAKKQGSLENMVKIAHDYVTTKELFMGTKEAIATIDIRYFQLAALVQERGSEHVDTYFKKAFEMMFDEPAREVMNNTDNFHVFKARVGDSLVSSAVDKLVSAKTKSLITYVVYALYLIERLASEDGLPNARAEDFIILLPDGIFPLPIKNSSLETQRNEESKKRQAAKAANAKAIMGWAGQLEANKNAINEVLGLRKAETPTPASVVEKRTTALSATRTGIFFDKLSPETQKVLNAYELGEQEVDIARSVTVIEKANISLAENIYKNVGQNTPMVLVGSTLVPGDIYNPPNSLTEGVESLKFLGVCPPAAIEPFGEEVSVPDDKQPGQIPIPYIADLMVLEQTLNRYELGEIAHVENVLKSEFRKRTFTTSKTTEQSTLTEEEVTDEKTKDLTSTDRYELQSETQNVINENASTEAGVTVSASYGPSVDVTANFNYANNTSKEDSRSASSKFARDTTTRAVSRLEKRTLTRTFTKTVEAVEEVNEHGFDNKCGTDNIIGVYRWLDKIYDAQIVNYGKRLMLDLIVPEPAAFLRYAMTKQPREGVTLVKPDVPGYCLADGHTFEHLKVKDIKPDEYLVWVGKYEVQDVTTPPSTMHIISFGKSAETMVEAFPGPPAGPKISSKAYDDIVIPAGYYPHDAVVKVYGETQGLDIGPHQIVIQIQNKQMVYTEPFDDDNAEFTVSLTEAPHDKISFSVNTIAFHNFEVLVTITCTLAPATFEEWQLSTYNAIMNAYNDKKARYEDAIEAAKIQEGFNPIQGKNPSSNRETEKTELKKGCIALLTGQRFEKFGAMNRNVAPYSYPEIDFPDAQAEGRFISFFEQAFEWTNMTYVFYPYFWGLKDEWVTTSQLDDTDPLFAKFLQAGSARVQVPVRVGFGRAVLNYRAQGGIWNSEGTHIPLDENGEADPMHLSIIAELMEQTGNNSKDGKGTVAVENGKIKVVGVGTKFKKEDDPNSDVNRRIIIKGKTYVIEEVVTPTEITLKSPYQKETGDTSADTKLPYALGGVLVGQTWEVKLPTSLVKIDDNYEKTLLQVNH